MHIGSIPLHASKSLVSLSFFIFIKAKQDGGPRSLTRVSNNAQARFYINSSVNFKHKGLES